MFVKKRKKWPRVLMVLTGVFIFVVIIFKLNKPNKETPREEESKQTYDLLPGLEPVDIYLSLENDGFDVEMISGHDVGVTWVCKKSVVGLDYETTVHTPSKNGDGVKSVRAMVMINPAIKKPEAALPFLKYISSLPYEKSDPERAMEWLEKYLNIDNSSIQIGEAKYILNDYP